MERILALKRVTFFRSLPLDTLARVDSLLHERSYAAGEPISGRAGNARCLCVLLRGKAAVKRAGQLERVVAAGDTFGETSVIDSDVPLPAVVALEPCQVLAMNATIFYDLAREHPEMWVEVSRALARRLDGVATEEALVA